MVPGLVYVGKNCSLTYTFPCHLSKASPVLLEGVWLESNLGFEDETW